MDNRLMSYLYYFNVAQDYYECHEYGEHLWLESGRPLVLKGLIQAAVCLYHLGNGNLKGGHKMWLRAKSYLNPSRPLYEHIDLDKLISDIDAVWQRVPRTWYGNIVPVAAIEALDLPIVTIRITDDEIVQQLPTWIPLSLGH